MSKGFGQSRQTEEDKLVERLVRYCHQRNPEALDRIFDALAKDEELSRRICNNAFAQLQSDLDTLSWFCGYMASEINRSEDNERADKPIVELSKTLVMAGMQPPEDFMPYPGQRIVILAPEKFLALPESVSTKLKRAFDLVERSGEEFYRINEAIRQELGIVPPKGDERSR